METPKTTPAITVTKQQTQGDTLITLSIWAG